MRTENVFIVDILTDNSLNKAMVLEANVIISNEVKTNQNIPAGVKLINSEIYRKEGSWEVYKYNSKIVDKLCVKSPEQFVCAEINLKPAIYKLIYWTNHKLGSLKFAFDKMDGPKLSVNEFKLIRASKSREIFKYFKHYFLNNWKWLKSKNQYYKLDQSKASIGVLINDEFELILYLDTIKLIGDCIVFHYGNIDVTKYLIQFNKTQFVDLSKLKKLNYQPFSNPFLKNAEELFVTNVVLKDWVDIASEIEYYRLINRSGIKKLLINVGENLPLRNLMPQIFKSNIMIYNTMNGLKSGEAHDADVNFDKWFVWDKSMHKLLNTQCNIPEGKLIISGHLSEDQIANHEFRNSIEIDLKEIENKIVISIFSVRGHRKEKIDVFKLLFDFLKVNPNYFLIVKPHPFEKKSDYIYPETSLKNIYYIPEELKNFKSTIFDQLILSDLTIVFGSTVALESNWMEVPCISFEYKEESFIYNLEYDFIEHLKDEKQLLLRLQNTIKKGTKTDKKKTRVCEIISSQLLIK